MEKYNNALIIDDDPVSNFISKLLLNRYKVAKNIFVSQDVDSAFEQYGNFIKEDGMPDLILLDIKMPEKDGFQFLEEFNQKYYKDKANTEIGILTNSNSSDDLQKMLSLGADYWINKPLKKEILVNLTEIQVE